MQEALCSFPHGLNLEDIVRRRISAIDLIVALCSASMMGLASLIYSQGKYAKAEAMHRQMLQLKETVLRKDHPDTLASMNNLAISLHNQGKYAEAEAKRSRAGGRFE